MKGEIHNMEEEVPGSVVRALTWNVGDADLKHCSGT